ncbi:MAG: Ig-like domain-containing protein [Roseobacter sp.]
MARKVWEQFETTEPAITLEPDNAGQLVVPDSAQLFHAAFERSGSDLLLLNDVGENLRIPGYFLSDPPADLFDAAGAMIRGAHVALMAGPIAPGQYADASGAGAASPIGQVETLEGGGSVQRVDGTVEDLQIGMKIFQQDVLQTDTGATLAVTFVDGTIFTLASASRMVIDALIYDPDASDNSGGFSLIQGSFVFIAGQVAKTGGMEVSTPSSTMGIRGTTVVVEVASENGVVTSEVTLTEDIDGAIGRIELRDIDGNLIADITETNTKWIVQAIDGGTREVVRDAQDELSDSILIAEAFAAYRVATARVDAGDTFVTLSDPAPSDQNGQVGSGVDLDLDVDAIDEPEAISPPQQIDEAPPVDENLPSDDSETFLEEIPTEEPLIIVVNGVEDAPEADPIVGTAATLLPPDLTFSLASEPENGVLDISEDGDFTFVPDPDFNGAVTFAFTATDAEGATVGSGTVLINVLPINDAPEAADVATSVVEDGVVSGGIPATDIDGDTLSYSVTGLPSFGVVVLLTDGRFSYAPDADFTGSDSFTVTATDAAGETAASVVTVTVFSDSDTPEIVTTVEELKRDIVEADIAVVTSGIIEATDADEGATLVWSGSAAGIYGSFAIAANGSWTYTLDPETADALSAGETVTEVFTATVTDDTDLTAAIDVPITITGTEDAPVIISAPSDVRGSLIEGEELVLAEGQVRAEDPDGEGSVTWSGTSLATFGAFTIAADGSWSYTLDNAPADELSAGEIATEIFVAVGEDVRGETVTQNIEVTITGTNDLPVLTPVTSFEGIESTVLSGGLTATDVDGELADLSFSLGPFLPENGTVVLASDGTFDFTPDPGFVGVETFQYQVTDGDGGISTAVAKVLVESDPDAATEKSVDVDFSLEATEETAAGSFAIELFETETTSVNLAIALDRSSSIGASAWADLLSSVETSVETLSDLFEGSDTDVDVQIITFATNIISTEIFDLDDPELIDAINPVDLPYSGGSTAWNLAFAQAGTFFFSEPSTELSFLLFVTDGIPTTGTWETPFDALVDSTDDYNITVEAFGFGPFFEEGSLEIIDDEPVIFSDPDQLSDAFEATPVFNPELIGFSIELEALDGTVVEIADETAEGLIVEGTSFQMPLASIAGIEALLGDSNRINITALFDLDNDLSTTDVTLFSSEIIGKADTAQTLVGFSGADLLLGSDASDSIVGAGGGDVILGYGGDDTISGGAGADRILAGSGDDLIQLLTTTEAGDMVDGGAGRDVLAIDAVGEINAMIATLDISGIEALDTSNGRDDALALTIDALIGLSDTEDTELEELLDDALLNSRSIYGEAGDTLELDGQSIYAVAASGTVTDGDGNNLDIYSVSDADGNVLATLGVDSDIAVVTSNVIV